MLAWTGEEECLYPDQKQAWQFDLFGRCSIVRLKSAEGAAAFWSTLKCYEYLIPGSVPFGRVKASQSFRPSASCSGDVAVEARWLGTNGLAYFQLRGCNSGNIVEGTVSTRVTCEVIY